MHATSLPSIPSAWKYFGALWCALAAIMCWFARSAPDQASGMAIVGELALASIVLAVLTWALGAQAWQRVARLAGVALLACAAGMQALGAMTDSALHTLCYISTLLAVALVALFGIVATISEVPPEHDNVGR